MPSGFDCPEPGLTASDRLSSGGGILAKRSFQSHHSPESTPHGKEDFSSWQALFKISLELYYSANILSVNRFIDFTYENREKNITQMFMLE